MKPNKHSENKLVSFGEFIRKMRLLNKADEPELVLKLVVGWTKGQPFLTKKLLQYVLQSPQNIPLGKETIAVEKIVRERLLKEFKQDNLTLGIRFFLYQKKLDNILKQTNKSNSIVKQNYLKDLQRELGLTDQQCRAIRKRLLKSELKQVINKSSLINIETENRELDLKSHNFQIENHSNSKEIVSLNKQASQSKLNSQLLKKENSQLTSEKSLNKKWFGLLLIFPILFLLIKGLNGKSDRLKIASESVTEQQSLCIDLSTRSSPRMSLGEKILTPEHSNLKPQSKIPLYEGSAAFARCEFANAKQKFQQSLIQGKNNPEALIYLNNVSAITQDYLKIAVSVPLGTNPDIAWEILRGVAQAQAQINQQDGIGEKLLLVQIVDDDNNPEIVRQVAKQLAADESILAVVGHNDSNASIAGSEIYQKEGLVMISPTSTSTELSGIGSYIFRTVFSVAALANTLADYASVNTMKNITICFDSMSSASNSFVEEFILEMTRDRGQQTTVKCDFAQEDFNPQLVIQQSIAQNADTLLLAPSVEHISSAIAVARANQRQLDLLGNHALYTYETIQKGQDAVARMVLPSPWLPNTNSPDNFEQTAQKYWGGTVNWRTATSYDATSALIKGLQQAKTRSQLQTVLTRPNFFVEGATGKITFEKGDLIGLVELAEIVQSNDNSSQYRFAPLKIGQ